MIGRNNGKPRPEVVVITGATVMGAEESRLACPRRLNGTGLLTADRNRATIERSLLRPDAVQQE